MNGNERALFFGLHRWDPRNPKPPWGVCLIAPPTAHVHVIIATLDNAKLIMCIMESDSVLISLDRG